MTNQCLKDLFLQMVDNQLNDDSPPATRITYERLQSLGYNQQQAKEKIASAALVETYNSRKAGEQFNEARYVKDLEELD